MSAPSNRPVWEVFRAFLGLGLTSFGGPVAHLGYFRDAFVTRRGWLSDRAYADLVALCQFLPGPASSQVGMAIGLQRAGLAGLIAAWLGFTLPSAIALTAFALGVSVFGDVLGGGWIAGLMAAAVAIVAHAVIGMGRSLAPDAPRATIAALALIAVVIVPSPLMQVSVIVLAAFAGIAFTRAATDDMAGSDLMPGVSRRVGAVVLVVFAALLVALPVLATATGDLRLRLADVFFRAGALVFGGGHVVLPLLEADLVGTRMIPADVFLAGYGAAQAVPGPLFTVAAFLGASTPAGFAGAVIALLAVFVPGALLLVGVLPFWARLSRSTVARRALNGVNAAVVGILGAALYDPVFTHGVTSPVTFAIAVSVFVAQGWWRVPPWVAVLAAAVAGGVLVVG